jgi:hypothetical protein
MLDFRVWKNHWDPSPVPGLWLPPFVDHENRAILDQEAGFYHWKQCPVTFSYLVSEGLEPASPESEGQIQW